MEANDNATLKYPPFLFINILRLKIIFNDYYLIICIKLKDI